MLPPPPGTKRISKNLFVDKVPITVENWLEYIQLENLNASSESFVNPMLDTALYLAIYKKTPQNDLPLIGKSLEELNSFCLWRTKMVNALIYQPKPLCSKKYWKKCKQIREKKLNVLYYIPSYDECKMYDKGRVCHISINYNHSSYINENLPLICYAKYE